jgi:xanthine dehydrogenase YagS FAD-binding subunit
MRGVHPVIPFAYLRADDVAGAVAAVADHPDAVFLAGGTNLVDRMKLGVAAPSLVVDISHLPLDQIVELPDGTVRIGATARNSDLAAHLLIRDRYPVLAQALLSGASGQLRNLATTAGNLLQRTRCVYFQDVSMPCNKRDPSSGCSAREGYTRYHAILGGSAGCVAVHPSDMAVAMSVLDASVLVMGRTGERTIQLVELHRLPGDTPHQDTVLGHGELITAVDLPPFPFSHHSAYRKVRDRASYAFALVSVAAALHLGDGRDATGSPTIRDVRIAFGGVAHKPWRATAAENFLRGTAATVANFREAADVELAQAETLNDNAFKVTMVRNTVALLLADLTRRQVGDVGGDLACQEQKP